MERYIGLDVHAQSTSIGVLAENGKRISSMIVETKASTLIDALKGIRGTRRLIFEEGTQSAWLSEVLRPFVHELVVTSPAKTVGRAKSDYEDAFARAEELRRNAVDIRIFKPAATALPLREALRLYMAFNKDVVRAKNRFKALLRGRGITGLGREIYDPEPDELRKLLDQVPPSIALSAEATLEQIYMLEDLRSRACEVLLDEAYRWPGYRFLISVPGMGPKRAATMLAVVVTPERFRTSHQFWSYAGLGIQTATSSDYRRGNHQNWVRHREPLTRGLKHGNALLKNVFKGAAESVAIRMTNEHPIKRHYERLLKNGMKENLARLTVARKLAAISLAVWKNKEEYNPTKHHSFE
jgi:transposase